VTEEPPGHGGLAYVTVLSTDSYLDGVLVLDDSLRRSGACHTLHVVVGSKVGDAARSALETARIPQIVAEPIDVPEEIVQANLDSDHHPHWAGVFEKALVFSLCQFRKIVFLDSDMLVLKNIDSLFERPHMSAVTADKYPGGADYRYPNAGLMVIEPEPGLADKLLALLPEAYEGEKRWRRSVGRPPSVGMQSLINGFWSDWAAHTELQLDSKYNVIVNQLDYFVRDLGYKWRGSDGIHVLHFIGYLKPWMTSELSLPRWTAGLLARRRVWELAALMMYTLALRRARQRLGGAGPT
jgi:hypothetical protein